jgi:PAS domain S-box-containing protein
MKRTYKEEELLLELNEARAKVTQLEARLHKSSELKTITDNEQTKHNLEENELKFDQLFQSIPLPTFIFKHVKGDFLLEDYNQKAFDATMGRILNFTNKPALALYPNLPYFEYDLEKCINEKKPIRREVKYRSITSNVDVYLINTYSFMPPDMVSLYTIDITKLKNSEESMRASEERIQTIFESTSDGIIIADLDGIIVSSNTMACELFQRKYEDLMGMHLVDIIPSIDGLKLKRGCVEAWITGPLEKEGIGKRSEDESFPVEISSVIYTEKAGPRASIFIRDITGRKIAEKANTEIQKMKTANKIAITVAHEFSNPLSIIKGYVDIIHMTKDMPEEKKNDLLSKIRTQIKRMHELVDKLLKLRELKDIPYIDGIDFIDIHRDDEKE